MDTLYPKHVMEHYRTPHNRGAIDDPDFSCQVDNPLCGDVVRVGVLLQDGKVRDAKFTGHGCVICIAAASILTDEIVGKSTEELEALDRGEALRLLGMELGPVREKCALLPLRALKHGLQTWRMRRGG